MTLDTGASAGRPAHKWIVLVVASAGLFLSLLDVSLNVALPNITNSFATDIQTVQWIIILYVGTATGLQLSLGSAADTYGLKRVYILGLVGYTVAVLVIALAPNLPVVLGLRIFQAIGNGLVAASVPALITRSFPAGQRGTAMGIMATIATAGMITGSLGSGFLVDAFGWRAVFLARVPVGVVIILLAVTLLREQRPDRSGVRFDFAGALTLFVGLASFIGFLTLGGRNGWTSVSALLLAFLSPLFLALFVRVERTTEHPLLDLALLKHRVLSFGTATAYLMYMGIFLNWFVLPFYVTGSLGASARDLGLLLTLTPVVGAVAAPLGGWCSDRTSPAYVTTLALLILAGAMGWFSSLDEASTLFDVGLRTGLTGLGIGLFQASNASLVMGSVPASRLGAGGAFIAVARNMGTVSSVAVLGFVFAARVEWHTASLAAMSVVGEPVEAQGFIRAFRDVYLISAALVAAAAVASLAYCSWPARKR